MKDMRSTGTTATLTILVLALNFQETFSFILLTKSETPTKIRKVGHGFPPLTSLFPRDPLPASEGYLCHFVSLRQNQDISSSKDDSESNEKISPLLRLVSSPIGALAVLACVVLFHESGHYIVARSMGVNVDEFSVGIGPKLFGFQVLGDQFNLRVLPLGGFVSLNKASLAAIPALERILIYSAGVLFNLLFSFIISTYQIWVGKGLTVPVFDSGILVSGHQPSSPSRGVLHTGDIIEAVNGHVLLHKPTGSEWEVQRAITRLISQVQETQQGDAVIFTVRDPETEHIRNVSFKPKMNDENASQPPSVEVFLSPNFIGIDTRKTDNMFEAMEYASSYVACWTKEIAIGLATYAQDLVQFRRGGNTSEYQLSGPVRVIQKATKVVQTHDMNTILSYAAAASINLGMINCLPIPPSDGFQIVYTAIDTLFMK